MLHPSSRRRIFFRKAGRCQALALAWLLACLLSLPLGATRHAMTHLGSAPAASHGAAGQQRGPDSGLDHCNSCDAWNALYAVLLPAPPAMPAGCPGPACFISPARSIDTAPARWFMQRAPPRPG
ncbi:hypothetical protein [Pollutimonas bauzanensis]|uniref:DUF2946 domain-containing protein n=1 Tax=Pollutimonas bauzanensis TaxID=658167 RepID=A0A1M5VY99_9BURK|nr:hypothetical protein [Pollutimonas bauzanensis]SHH80168.1 hypothetical protein SAMN04488135_1058 [Pollutimonas bauzanensis]